MGFADSAIAVVKSNRRLQKRTLRPTKMKISKKQPFNKTTPRVGLTEECLERVKIKEVRNLIRDLLMLLIVIIVSIVVMDFLFFE